MSLVDGTVESRRQINEEPIYYQKLDPFNYLKQEKIQRLSLVDGSFPRNCGVPQCGVRKLTAEEAIRWRLFGPPDVPPELEMADKEKYWLKDLDYARKLWPEKDHHAA